MPDPAAPPVVTPPVAPAGGAPTVLATPPDPPLEGVKPPAAPEKYDLKLPEGSPFDASAIERTAAYARERGLTNDQAQALLERESSAVKGFADAQQANLKATMEGWVKAAQSDTEIGGANFGANVEMAKRALTRYGTDEFRKALEETGLGNHPEVVRTFLRIGKAMAEDRTILTGGAPRPQRSMEEIFYGTPEAAAK